MQFDRIYKLTVGIEGKDGVELEGKPNSDGLDISFDIIKDLNQTTNKCKLLIRNLTSATAKKLEREDSVCVLEVGYSEDIGLRRIFVGIVLTAKTKIDGTERICELEMADGHIAVRDTNVSLSYERNVSRKKAIDDVAVAMGLAVKYAEDCEFTNFANGFSFIGKGRNCLDKVCEGTGLNWSIQNNSLQIIKSGGTNKPYAILLTAESGLIGFVERIVKGPKKTAKKKSSKGGSSEKKEKKEKKAGWKLQSLLNPTLSPGDLVKIETRDVTGWFKIESLRHTGQYRGSDWYTEMEVYEIK